MVLHTFFVMSKALIKFKFKFKFICARGKLFRCCDNKLFARDQMINHSMVIIYNHVIISYYTPFIR